MSNHTQKQIDIVCQKLPVSYHDSTGNYTQKQVIGRFPSYALASRLSGEINKSKASGDTAEYSIIYLDETFAVVRTYATKETLKSAGYSYVKYEGDGMHLLKDSTGKLEVWFNNKNHPGYGLIFKNTHLEFAHSR